MADRKPNPEHVDIPAIRRVGTTRLADKRGDGETLIAMRKKCFGLDVILVRECNKGPKGMLVNNIASTVGTPRGCRHTSYGRLLKWCLRGGVTVHEPPFRLWEPHPYFMADMSPEQFEVEFDKAQRRDPPRRSFTPMPKDDFAVALKAHRKAIGAYKPCTRKRIDWVCRMLELKTTELCALMECEWGQFDICYQTDGAIAMPGSAALWLSFFENIAHERILGVKQHDLFVPNYSSE